MRKSHVRTFARSLQGYEASLQLDLKIILQTIEPKAEWDADAVRNALNDHDTLDEIREFLGDHANAFQQTLEDVYEILEVLTRSIEGLLDASAGEVSAAAQRTPVHTIDTVAGQAGYSETGGACAEA